MISNSDFNHNYGQNNENLQPFYHVNKMNYTDVSNKMISNLEAFELYMGQNF